MKLAQMVTGTAIALACITSASASGPTVDAAIDVGLSAEAVCASGVTPAEAGNILSLIQQATTERSAITAAKLANESASQALAAIDAQLATDPLNSVLAAQRATAVTTLASARTTLEQARSTLRQVATATLSSSVATYLSRSVRQAAMRAPAAIRAGDWSVGKRKRIEAALIAEQRAAGNAELMPEGAAELLASVRADAAVTAAAQAVATNQSQIQSVYSQFEN